MISIRAAGMLRGLIYPVQFERDPLDGIPRVVELVGRDGNPKEFLAAIAEGLQSGDALADLKIVIRRFLSATALAIRVRWAC